MSVVKAKCAAKILQSIVLPWPIPTIENIDFFLDIVYAKHNSYTVWSYGVFAYLANCYILSSSFSNSKLSKNSLNSKFYELCS